MSAPAQSARTGLGVEAIKRGFLDNLFFIQGRFPAVATKNDYYQALAYTVRDRLLARWIKTAEAYKAAPTSRSAKKRAPTTSFCSASPSTRSTA
jgi:hypothetical protein